MDKNTILNRLYTSLVNNPASFSSIRSLYNAGKKEIDNLTIEDVKNFLQGQKAYTLHKNTYRNFPRRKVIAPRPGVIVSCDLADMSKLSQYNDGYKYLLVAVDVFSRYAQVVPLRSKNASHTLSGLKKIRILSF